MKSAIVAWLLATTFASGALAQEHLDKDAIEKYGLKFLGEEVVKVPAIEGLMPSKTVRVWRFALPDIHGLPRQISVSEYPSMDEFTLADEECCYEALMIYEYLKRKTGKTEF